MTRDLLEYARSWIGDAEGTWLNPPLTSQVDVSPQEHDPRSISWIVEGPVRIAQIVIWEDGQSELDLGEVATGVVQSEQRFLASHIAADDALRSIQHWLMNS